MRVVTLALVLLLAARTGRGPRRPDSRGQTPAETLLYQVVAHALGHALGLDHTMDPRSIMCCVKTSVDFKDLIAREAYVDARRHPDLRSVASQLGAHYGRFWSR